MALTMSQVFAVVQGERARQTVIHGTAEEHPHSVAEWILILDSTLYKAREMWCRGGGDEAAMEEILQLTAVGFACLEEHGRHAPSVPVPDGPEVPGAGTSWAVWRCDGEAGDVLPNEAVSLCGGSELLAAARAAGLIGPRSGVGGWPWYGLVEAVGADQEGDKSKGGGWRVLERRRRGTPVGGLAAQGFEE